MTARRWLLAALSMGLMACTSSTAPSGGNEPAAAGGFDRRTLLAGVAQMSLRQVDGFAASAAALRDATAAWSVAQASAAADLSTRHEAARAAWRTALAAWSRLEALGYGPAGAATLFTGGQGLRDEIYSWPVTSPCRVDQKLAESAYAAPGFPSGELVNVYGLAALEYLLFAPGPGNACAPQAQLNQGTWTALGEAEVARRRAAYAAVLGAQLVTRAEALQRAWRGDEGGASGFAQALSQAGLTGSPFGSAQAAVNELFAALYMADRALKDARLADPAGISATCQQEVCPELLESPFAHAGKEALRENLVAVRMLLLGDGADEAAGFDDWLRAAQAPALAESIAQGCNDAIAAVDAIPGTLHEALAAAPESVRQAHAAVKQLTDLLKSQFVTTLNLAVPQEGAADND